MDDFTVLDNARLDAVNEQLYNNIMQLFGPTAGNAQLTECFTFTTNTDDIG